MNNDNSFGKKLQKLRKAKGLTQAKLAELADVHEKHISKLELGTYMPSYKTLNKILAVLEVGAEDIASNFEKVSINDNPFYIKSLQILNNATEQELEFYYGIIKQCKISLEMFK